MSDNAKTEKLHVLAVLEDGTLKNAYGIRSMLEKYFDLKPCLNALRKNLQRCFEQGLVRRVKIVGSYRYGISEKGRERLRLIRAKRQEKFDKPVVSQTPLVAPENFWNKRLLGRAFEVTSTIEPCDIVLRLSSDNATLNFANCTRIYWMLEYLRLVPCISEQMAKKIERILAHL